MHWIFQSTQLAFLGVDAGFQDCKAIWIKSAYVGFTLYVSSLNAPEALRTPEFTFSIIRSHWSQADFNQAGEAATQEDICQSKIE